MHFETGTISTLRIAEPDLREAAARTHDAVPGAKDVLLFWSRARDGRARTWHGRSLGFRYAAGP